MSAQTLPAVYETFRDVFGRKSSMEELIAEISKYERSSILWICAEIVCRVQLWARPALHNRRNYLAYLQDFFEPSVSRRLIAGSQSTFPVRLVFNRRQIGLVAKLALKHCGNGLDARKHRNGLGVVFLMANDQLDHGLLEGAPASSANARDANIRMVTEMVAVQEGGSPDIANLFTRGHLMLTRYARELAGAHDFVDVVGEFERKIGLTLLEFDAMVFAIHSRFGAGMSNQVVANPMQSLEPEVRMAINSIYSELVGTGTSGPTPERPATFGPNAAGREADHGVFTQARSSTMEPKNGSGREENQTTAVPSRGKILQFAGKMRASNLEGDR